MKNLSFLLLILSFGLHAQPDYTQPVPGQWSKKKINKWYQKQPWLVGTNYYPATAINQIDMWQASTWDLERIDLELSWAREIGMNTLRVYLHDLVWADDEEGLYQRMDEFLTICEEYGIKPWFVFFDDCHFPNPTLGEQPSPVKAYHNSGWVNSPARDLAWRYSKGEASDEEVSRLKGYIQKTMSRFKDDNRVLLWELYNEPGNGGIGLHGKNEGAIREASNRLLYDSWVWAREINPSQPICSTAAGSVGKTNVQISTVNSDVHSVHFYGPLKKLANRVKPYQETERPIIMTEWLARTNDNTVFDILPALKEMNIGAINWGFVAGESGTIWPWSSRRVSSGPRNLTYEREIGFTESDPTKLPEPEVWFHDLLRFDGSPYNPKEIALFKELTSKK